MKSPQLSSRAQGVMSNANHRQKNRGGLALSAGSIWGGAAVPPVLIAGRRLALPATGPTSLFRNLPPAITVRPAKSGVASHCAAGFRKILFASETFVHHRG